MAVPGDGGAWSRRALLRRAATLGGGLAAAQALPWSALSGAASVGQSGSRGRTAKVGVVLPDYPYFPGTIIVEDQRLLDSLAASYAKQRGRQPLEMTRFLFGEVPVTLFDRIFATRNPATTLPIGSYLWLFHLSGYFGGVWLRSELVKTGKNPTIAGVSIAQTQQAFNSQAAKAQAVLDAASGDGPAVLAYNRASLFDQPDPDNPARPVRGLADTYGYNEGYLLQIVEKPPEGLTPRARFVVCPSDPASRPLSCSYATTELQAVKTYDPVSKKLASGKGAYAGLKSEIVPVQQSAIERGRRVWDGALNVQGFSQEAYTQLLDISSAFLETVQATALSTVEAVAQADVAVGRRAATANACMSTWLASYTVGLIDGRPDRALPTFRT